MAIQGSPYPPRKPMWQCEKCKTNNEDFRAKCRKCGADR
jgi:hypothetical protein